MIAEAPLRSPGVLLCHDPVLFAAHRGASSAAAFVDGQMTQVDNVATALPPASLWLTNVSSRSLAEAGYRRGPMRGEDFLGTRVQGLLAEAGLTEAGIADQGMWLLQLGSRVLQLCEDRLSVCAADLEARTLSIAIARTYFRRREPPASAQARYALGVAGQSSPYAGRAINPGSDERAFVLRHHRQAYAARMLGARVPQGDWATVAPPRVDPEGQRAWLADTLRHRPLLVRVDARFRGGRSEELAMLAGVSGVSSGAAAASARNWVTGVEALAIAEHADLDVHEALAADRYAENPWDGLAQLSTLGPAGGRPMPCGPLLLLGRAQVSNAEGVVCEALWHSLVSGARDSAVAVWLDGHDRAACFTAAADLMARSPRIRVTGFARGRLWTHLGTDHTDCAGDEERLLELAKLAVATRLVPPSLPVPPERSERLRVAAEAIHLAQSNGQLHDPALLVTAQSLLGRRPQVQPVPQAQAVAA